MARLSEWTKHRLREVTVETELWNPRSDPRLRIQYVDVSSVSRHSLSIVTSSPYSAVDAPGRARKIVRAGDTIIATIRPSLRRIAEIPPSLDGEIVSTAFCVLRPNVALVDPGFLFFLSQTEGFMSGVSALETGASYPAVRDSDVLDQQILLPPLREQQGISAVLRVMRAAFLGESHCEAAADALKGATMRALFTRGLRGEAQKETEIGRMPASWQPKTILELCSIWSGGTPRKSASEYWDGDIPWVSGKDLKSPSLDDAIDHITMDGVDEASRLAPADSILLLVRGMGLAKDLPVAVIARPMAFNQDIKALVSRGHYSGSFLRSAIYFGKERLLRKIVPSAHGTMTLNLNDVETFELPCPTDPEEANEIAATIQAIDRKIGLHRRKRDVIDALFKALLNKLMTGEIHVADLALSTLVPTGNIKVAA